MSQPTFSGPLQIVCPFAYGLCPDGALDSLPEDIREQALSDLQHAAERAATKADKRLVGESRFLGAVPAPAWWTSDSEGVTWLGWEYDVEDLGTTP